MSEKNDVYSEVKGQMRLSERIAAFIPGFRGYKEKEIRRESDRLIRNHSKPETFSRQKRSKRNSPETCRPPLLRRYD